MTSACLAEQASSTPSLEYSMAMAEYRRMPARWREALKESTGRQSATGLPKYVESPSKKRRLGYGGLGRGWGRRPPAGRAPEPARATTIPLEGGIKVDGASPLVFGPGRWGRSARTVHPPTGSRRGGGNEGRRRADAPARSVGRPRKIPEDPPGEDEGSAWPMPNAEGPKMGGAGAVVNWWGVARPSEKFLFSRQFWRRNQSTGSETRRAKF